MCSVSKLTGRLRLVQFNGLINTITITYNTSSLVLPMIFRLISSQLGSSSPDYGSHIIMSISGIFFTYINPHIISFSSPILISGARNNIDHIMVPARRSNCTQCPRSRTFADVPYIFVRGQSCASVRMISNTCIPYWL